MKLSAPQTALLERLSAGSIEPVGREFLTGKALVRMGLAQWIPLKDDAGKPYSSLWLTNAGWERLKNPEKVKGTRRVGIRLPLAVQPHLDRGRKWHGSNTAAIVIALKQAFPSLPPGQKETGEVS